MLVIPDRNKVEKFNKENSLIIQDSSIIETRNKNNKAYVNNKIP